MTNIYNFTGITTGKPVDKPQGGQTKRGQFLCGGTTPAQSEKNHGPHVAKTHGTQMKDQIDTVLKILHIIKTFGKFFLSKNDNLQQLAGIGFIVKKFTYYFKTLYGNFLPFINKQNNGSIILNPFFEQKVLNAFLALPRGRRP